MKSKINNILKENGFFEWLKNSHYQSNSFFNNNDIITYYKKLPKYIQLCIILEFLYENYDILLQLKEVKTTIKNWNIYVNSIENKILEYFNNLKNK